MVRSSAGLSLKGKADVGKLELKLLGVPEARLDGRVLTLRTKKALALLVYLVVERGPHQREELAELLWPKSGRSKDRMALRQCLGRPATRARGNGRFPRSTLAGRARLLELQRHLRHRDRP